MSINMEREYEKAFDNVEYTTNEKLKILNNLIARTISSEDLIKYHVKRAFIQYELKNFQEVLNDINVLKTYGNLNDTISIIMWKSIIHLQMKKIRDDIEGEMSIADKTFFIISRKCCSLDIGEINQQKQYLLDFISENNMNQLMESK